MSLRVGSLERAINPGGELQCAVVDGMGCRSVDWRMWTSSNYDDVHIEEQLAAGVACIGCSWRQ